MRITGHAILIFTIISGFSISAGAQRVHLTLEKAIQAAWENNRQLQIAALEQQGAEARFRQSGAVFLPVLNVSYSAMATDNPLNAFGFKLQQQSVTAQDFNPELLNKPGSTENYMVKGSWRQPLINLDGWAARKAAYQEQFAYSYKKARTRQYIEFEVRKAFAQYRMAVQARKVTTQSHATVREIHRETKNRFDKGYLQRADLLTAEVQLKAAENQVTQAESNVANAMDDIKLLIGAAGPESFEIDSVGLIEATYESDGTIVATRADFLAMESGVSAREKMIQSSKLSYLPNLNAFAEYYINDDEPLGFGSNSYMIGAQLSWTLFNGMATKHKITQLQVERQKAETELTLAREQARVELDKALRQFNDARLMLAQQEASVGQASEALRIRRNRYELGLASTNDVLQAEMLLSQQQLAKAAAETQLTIMASYIRFLTQSTEQ